LIEINLLPGSAKRSKRRVPKIALGGSFAKLPGLPKLDRGVAIMAAAWVVGAGALAYMFLGSRAREARLNDQVTAAVADSTRLAAIAASSDTLTKRMDVVAKKLTVVQDIDASRYIWPHLLDEISRALPAHTWLRQITNLPTDSGVKYPRFRLEGRTGNNFALTAYLQQLEASPFVRSVRLLKSELVREDDKLVYAFELEAGYENPPPDMIQTVPLFARADEPPDSVAAGTPAAATPAPGATGRPGTVTNASTTPTRKPRSQEP
jgi:Tfp pilus assembly protein PilN